MRNSNSAQMSLVLPQAQYTAARQNAARLGLSVAAYIRLILSIAQSGGDVSHLFFPSPGQHRKEEEENRQC